MNREGGEGGRRRRTKNKPTKSGSSKGKMRFCKRILRLFPVEVPSNIPKKEI